MLDYIIQVTDSTETIVSWQTEFTVFYLNKEIQTMEKKVTDLIMMQ